MIYTMKQTGPVWALHCVCGGGLGATKNAVVLSRHRPYLAAVSLWTIIMNTSWTLWLWMQYILNIPRYIRTLWSALLNICFALSECRRKERLAIAQSEFAKLVLIFVATSSRGWKVSGIVSLLNLKENVLQNDGSLRHGVGLSHKRVLDAISGATAPLALQVDTRYTMIKGSSLGPGWGNPFPWAPRMQLKTALHS